MQDPSQTRTFDPRVLASITSGRLLVPSFTPVLDALGFILGGPVGPATLSIPAFGRRAREHVLAQYPDMPTEIPDDAIQAVCARLLDRYGARVDLWVPAAADAAA